MTLLVSVEPLRSLWQRRAGGQASGRRSVLLLAAAHTAGQPGDQHAVAIESQPLLVTPRRHVPASPHAAVWLQREHAQDSDPRHILQLMCQQLHAQAPSAGCEGTAAAGPHGTALDQTSLAQLATLLQALLQQDHRDDSWRLLAVLSWTLAERLRHVRLDWYAQQQQQQQVEEPTASHGQAASLAEASCLQDLFRALSDAMDSLDSCSEATQTGCKHNRYAQHASSVTGPSQHAQDLTAGAQQYSTRSRLDDTYHAASSGEGCVEGCTQGSRESREALDAAWVELWTTSGAALRQLPPQALHQPQPPSSPSTPIGAGSAHSQQALESRQPSHPPSSPNAPSPGATTSTQLLVMLAAAAAQLQRTRGTAPPAGWLRALLGAVEALAPVLQPGEVVRLVQSLVALRISGKALGVKSSISGGGLVDGGGSSSIGLFDISASGTGSARSINSMSNATRSGLAALSARLVQVLPLLQGDELGAVCAALPRVALPRSPALSFALANAAFRACSPSPSKAEAGTGVEAGGEAAAEVQAGSQMRVAGAGPGAEVPASLPAEALGSSHSAFTLTAEQLPVVMLALADNQTHTATLQHRSGGSKGGVQDVAGVELRHRVLLASGARMPAMSGPGLATVLASAVRLGWRPERAWVQR